MENKEIGLNEIIKLIKQDVKINGDVPVTSNKLLNLLELALENITSKGNG
jgi:hypothetical protein